MAKNNKKRFIHRVVISRGNLLIKKGRLVRSTAKKRGLSVFSKSFFTVVSTPKPKALTPAQQFKESRKKTRKTKLRRISGVTGGSVLR